MIQVKAFPIAEYEKFNEFLKTHSPRGENGFKFHEGHLMVFYEEGVPMNLSDKVQSLRFELGKHLEQELQYKKQYLVAVKIRESFNYKKNKQSWENANTQCITSLKMLELEIMNTKTVLEMLAELGEKITVEHAEVESKEMTIPDKDLE